MLTAEPKAYGSNWHAATRVEGPARTRLTVELDIDLCVIGAGLAGLTVAREVARHGWSVVVLEAKSVAWSASGRNTGVVLPGFSVSADALIERVGLAEAKALWARSVAGAEYVRNAARDMPGAALSETGWLHVSKTDDIRALAHEAALVAGEFGATVETWPADRVREVLHSPRYFHGLHYPRGFSLHPLNYALGLAAAAETAGVRIFEDTPVLEIDPAGVRKRVVTRDSRVRAAHVVLAGNVHMTELVPQFAETLLPIFTSVVVTAPLGEALHEAIRFPGAVSDEAELIGYHHRVVDGRLMWSGRSTVRLGTPQQEANALVRRIRRTYPALRDVTAEQTWIGIAGHTVHGMPQIGEITPGLWLLGGFGGHGLAATAMGGEMLARAIVDNDRAWQMFSPFALVWAGGALGRTARQVSGWAHDAREMLVGALARTRDARRRRVAAAKAKEESAAKAATEAAAAAPPPMVPDEPPAVVEPAVAPVVEPVIDPVIEPVSEPLVQPAAPPATAAMAPEPPAAAEAVPAALPEVTYGSSGVAEQVAPPDVPGFMKRKRGTRRKSGPNAPAPVRSPPEDGPAG
jgi:glycine/D-amino acid oxidase-like deaminating enzyme